MLRILGTVTLGSWLLLLPILSEAKPKRPHPLPPATTAETTCQLLGTLTHAVTVDRNNGVSLVTTLQRLRGILDEAPHTLRVMEAITYVVFSDYHHTTTPAQNRHAAEVGCLTNGATNTPNTQY